MHSPMFMYETEVQDRVSSYHRQAEHRRQGKRRQDSRPGSWLSAMQTRLRTAFSRQPDEVQSWLAKPPEPQEQCC